jgi:hypothetical protein
VDRIVFFVAVPQLQQTYELRLQYFTREVWDCTIFVDGLRRSTFSGNGATSANELWGRVFAAIGAGEMAAAGD